MDGASIRKLLCPLIDSFSPLSRTLNSYIVQSPLLRLGTVLDKRNFLFSENAQTRYSTGLVRRPQ